MLMVVNRTTSRRAWCVRVNDMYVRTIVYGYINLDIGLVKGRSVYILWRECKIFARPFDQWLSQIHCAFDS